MLGLMGRVSLKRHGSRKSMIFFWLFLVCLLISLAIHLVFFRGAEHWAVSGFTPETYDQIVPRTFRMKRVEIDPKVLQESLPPDKKPPEEKKEIVLPPEKTITASAKAGPAPKNLLPKPEEAIPRDQPGTKGIENLLESPEKPTKDLSSLEIPVVPVSPVQLAEPMIGVQEGANTKGISTNRPVFSSLDELLAGEGAVTAQTAPILMPTDLLFEYDSDTLREEATAALKKLGMIISMNKGQVFRIEGHTDSFGTDEYNDALSHRRAQAVKNWLQTTMGIDASCITTTGYGKRKLMVPADRSVAEQQMNRRVEIVISTPNH
jgi:outer membrane protein OmpA-like peptidoglycan-associated protein